MNHWGAVDSMVELVGPDAPLREFKIPRAVRPHAEGKRCLDPFEVVQQDVTAIMLPAKAHFGMTNRGMR